MHVRWNCVADHLQTANGFPWLSIAALILSTASCLLLTAVGRTSSCSSGLFSWSPNCPLNSVERHAISVEAKKNRCLAFTLLEMLIRPEWTFIILLRCSQAWSAPTEMNGISLLVTDMFPSWSSRYVGGWLVFISCMSAMYLGQRRLYFIWSIAKNSLLSASPASRWRTRSTFLDASTKSKMVSTWWR